MITLLVVLATVLFMADMWTAYLAVMNLKRNIKNISPVAKPFAYFLLARGLLLDVMFNLVIGSVSFLELPREWLFTHRCERWIGDQRWRGCVARFWCHHFMDGFDPGGRHCE
jgi:hypothetical protein